MKKSNLLEYKGFSGTARYSAEDRMFVGEVIGIDDSVSYSGYTVDELIEHFENNVDTYLVICAEYGKTPFREYKGMFNVRISPEDHREASEYAQANAISLNQFVSRAIRHELDAVG